MITERDKRLAQLRTYVDAGEPVYCTDAAWLLDEIERLYKALETHKRAIATLEARDANRLGVRNDLQARVELLESKMEEIHPTLA